MKTKKLKLNELSVNSFVTKINPDDKKTIAGEIYALTVSISARVAITVLEVGVGCVIHGVVETAIDIVSEKLECGKHISDTIMDPILSNPSCNTNIPPNSAGHAFCSAGNNCWTQGVNC